MDIDVSTLELPHWPMGNDPTPYPSPLNGFASPYGREDAIIHLLDSV